MVDLTMADTEAASKSVDPTQLLFRKINKIVKPLVKAGIGSPLPVGLGAVVLESTGRKSGLRREVPLLTLRLGNRYLVSTVRENSQWVKNLEASNQAAVWSCGKRNEATASVSRGPLNVVIVDKKRYGSDECFPRTQDHAPGSRQHPYS